MDEIMSITKQSFQTSCVPILLMYSLGTFTERKDDSECNSLS